MSGKVGAVAREVSVSSAARHWARTAGVWQTPVMRLVSRETVQRFLGTKRPNPVLPGDGTQSGPKEETAGSGTVRTVSRETVRTVSRETQVRSPRADPP